MVINASVQYWYNGGLSLTYTVDPMLSPSGNPFKCHEEVLYLQPLIPPKRFDFFPPDWKMLRSRRVLIFLKKYRNVLRAVLMGTKSCTKILILPKIFPTRFRFTFYG